MIILRVDNGFPFKEVEIGEQRQSSTPKVSLAVSCHPSIAIHHACIVDSAVCCACVTCCYNGKGMETAKVDVM